MRIDEVITAPTTVAITQRFDDSYKKFSTASPSVVPSSTLRFCEAKLKNEPVAGNDKSFTGDPLKGFRRFHVISGKCMIIYNRVGNTLRLYDMVEHDAYEGRNVEALSSWLRKLDNTAFIQIDPQTYFNPNSHDRVVLSDEVKSEIIEIFHELIGEQAFAVLKSAIEHDDWSNVFEWINMLVPGIDPASVFEAFGGKEKLRNFILDQIQNFGLMDQYNQA